jgi:hypothetical protein
MAQNWYGLKHPDFIMIFGTMNQLFHYVVMNDVNRSWEITKNGVGIGKTVDEIYK